MRKHILFVIALCLHIAARGQTIEEIDLSGIPQPTQAKALRYWFDDDANSVNSVNGTDGSYSLDVSGIFDGLHTIHCQVIDENEVVACIKSSMFFKFSNMAASVTAQKLMYWFDDETTMQHVDVTAGIQILDASRLSDGLHTLHYQVLCSNGQMTPSMSSIFLRMNLNAEVSAAKSLRYWFDDDATTVTTTDIVNGTQTISVSGLNTGLHTLHYQLIDNNDKVGIPVTRLFFKDFDRAVAEGENRITKYLYWLNANNATMQTTELSGASNPYQLIALLPVQKEPIHSSSFHFEMTDGVPMIYAKNEFHIRFHDALGYFVDDSRGFIDYSVKQEVNAEWLESGVRTTIDKPTANAIKWYCLEAEPGDSLQFKLDRAATIQLFSPSGNELFCASGSESVKWTGCHVWESGTFYLALHDVTATYGTTVSIDYNHIDKYAVLRQDVAVVGNGGFSSITFEGNGFRDLYAVDLYTEEGDTISSSAIRHTSDAIVSILFDFTDKRTGKYNSIFHFTTEEKKFTDLVTVEESKDMQLALDVKCPSIFLRGTSTTYTITVKNNGNSTAFNVPMEIYISADDSFENIESVIFKDEFGEAFNSVTLKDIDKDSIDNETLDYINGVLHEFNGLQSFIVKNDSINGSIYGITDQLITIAPNSSTTFYMEIKSSSTVGLKVRIPSNWLTVHSQRDVSNSRKNSNIFDRDWCCEKEKWECAAEILANLVGLIPVAGCGSGVFDMAFYDTFEIACTDGVDLWDKVSNFCQTFAENTEKHKSYIQRGIGDLIGCVSGKLLAKIGALKNKLRDAIEARIVWQKKIKMYDRIIKQTEQAKEIARITGDVKGEEEATKTIRAYLDRQVDCKNEAQKLSNEIAVLESQIAQKEWEYRDIISNLDKFKNQLLAESECHKLWTKAKTDCPPNPDEQEEKSTPVNSFDPNEIYGYTAESGSKAVSAERTDVYYTIQFENDTTFATAAAHDIYLTDTLDASRFDLSTFAPTRIKIGDKEATLMGEQSFLTTIDMRPEINAIAQIEGTFDERKGVAKWHIASLDPMTMEPTNEPMDGVLPVNVDGKGIGEVSYDISLKTGLAHGTEVRNRAGIVFDQNDVIMTPTWTNIIDRIAPESYVSDVQLLNDSTATVSIETTDELSGSWRYNVYVQYGSGAWFLGAENVSIDTTATVKVYEGINHGFYVVVTDSAGNVEQKQSTREFVLNLGKTLQLDENSTVIPETATSVDVQVKRTIKANEWSTIVLPFAMTEEQAKAAFGNDVQLADFSGCKATYDEGGETITALKVNFSNVTAIAANHPYIIKVTEPVSEFTVYNVDVSPSEKPSVDRDEYEYQKDDMGCYDYNSFIGTYVANTEIPENSLFLNANKFWYSKGLSKSKAFRGYFSFYQILSDISNAESRIAMTFTDETTGVFNVENGRRVAEHSVYDLQGRQVHKPIEKGIYVKDGKKIVVK